MLTTNLLPLQEKKSIEREKTRRAVRYFAYLLSLIFWLGSILLLPAFLPAFFEEKEFLRSLFIEKNASEELRVEDSLDRARRIKTILSSLRARAATPRSISSFFEGIRREAGESIMISTFSVKKDGAVFIAGSARTRRDLLDFEQRLRDSGRFLEISSPLSNLIREADVNFSIQGKLKP